MSNLDVALRLRLVNQLGGPAKEAKRDLEGVGAAAKKLDGAKADKLAKDLGKTKTEAKGADAALQKVAVGAKKLESAKADRLARDLGKAKTEAKAGERALAQFQRTLRQLDGAHAERLVAGLRNATAASERLARSLRRVREEARAVDHGGRVPGHRVPAGPSNGEGGGLPPALVAGSKRLMGAVGAGYLGYRSVANSVRTVVDQDKAWAEVRKKVSGSPEQLAGLEKELRAMARQYGMSIAEAFQQAASAGAAGIEIGELPKAVRIGLMASKAWDTNAKETMQYMAQQKSGMGWNLDTLKDWADKVNALADASAASERDLVAAAQRSNAPGAAVGIDADTVLAITAAQISGGMPDEVASRWMNTFGSKLAGAAAGTDKQQEALKKYLKLDPKTVAKGMEKDARGTIMEVLKRFNDLKQQDRVAFGVSFFGQEWWDETARAAKVIPEITRMFEILNDKSKWSGSMEQNLLITLSTIENHWERIKAAASEVASEINKSTGASEAFNSAVDGALNTFEKLLERWQSASTDPGRSPLRDALFGVRPFAKPPGAAPTPPAAASPPSSDVDAWLKFKAAAARDFSPVPSTAAAEAEGTMERITQAISAGGANAIAAAQAIAERIKSIFSFTAEPIIAPRLGGSRPKPSAPTAPAAPATPGKGASVNRPVKVVINVNGAGKDGGQIGKEIGRQLAQLGNANSALFDIG